MTDGSEVMVSFKHEMFSFCRSDSNSFFGTSAKVLSHSSQQSKPEAKQSQPEQLSQSPKKVLSSEDNEAIRNAIILQNELMIKFLSDNKGQK